MEKPVDHVVTRPGRRLGDPEVRIPVAETFPLQQAAAAYDRFGAGGKVGKIVLEM